MPLRLRAVRDLTALLFNGVSYEHNDDKHAFDALNVMINQKVLDTRPGKSQFNEISLGAAVETISFFKNSSNTRYRIAKAGTTLYSVAASGSHTTITSSLTSGKKHRAVTMRDRHIVSCESDGLFAWNGTTWAALGQAVPAAPTAGVSGSGNSITASTYQVAYTFYSSTTGFETNIGAASSTVTVSGTGEQINVSAMATSATNPYIDKKRVYFKDVGNDGDWLFWEEVALATTTSTITTDATSTSTPPTKNAAPLSGGGKWMTIFNERLVVAGNNTYKNDILFSEQNLPDAWDDTDAAKTLYVSGGGEVTGVATGFFNDSKLDPYLVVFKARSTHIYSEIDGNVRFVPISDQVGCINGDTVRVEDGNVFFMSDNGWRAVVNGELLPQTLGTKEGKETGPIDDIFSNNGFVYQINKQNASNFFSVYYSELDQYITWISEAGSTTITKAWVWHKKYNAWFPYSFSSNWACSGEDDNGEEVVYLCNDSGYLFTHSIREDTIDEGNPTGGDGFQLDVDQLDVDKLLEQDLSSINAFIYLPWQNYEDWDASYNFRSLVAEAITGTTAIDVKAYVNYNRSEAYNYSLDMSGQQEGFVLDFSRLDQGTLTDGREKVRQTVDLNRTGINILIGFFQNTQSSRLQLLGAQLHVSKNGNQN